MNSIVLAWGMLQDPPTSYHSNTAYGLPVSPGVVVGGGIILNYWFGGDSTGYSFLTYHLFGSTAITDSLSGLGQTNGSIPFPTVDYGYMCV